MFKHWILVVCLSGLLHSAWGAANVPAPVVTAALDGEAVLACNANQEVVDNCIFSNDRSATSLLVRTGNDREGTPVPKNPGYVYTGSGLTRGECGIRIKNVKESDNGKWKCTLLTASGLLEGYVEVEILRKPDPPQFYEQRFQAVGENSVKEVTCLSANGQPQPKFKWFIGDKEIESSVLTPIQNRSENGRTYTFQTLKSYRFTWEDDGKALRCVLVHDSLGKDDKQEVSQVVAVYYQPRAGESKLAVKAPEVGTSRFILGFNMSGNPAPSVEWTIGKQVVQAGFASSDQRYEALPVKQLQGESGQKIARAELVIKKVQESDLNAVYKLTARNQIGVSNFEVRLSNDPDLEGGLGAGGIVGLVLGISVLVILIVLIVMYTRAKGMLCFKGDDGTSSEKERMGEDADSNKGATEETKPTLAARFSAFYESLMSKKKDKTAPMDEEAPKDKEKDAPADEKKQDDPIVYVELDHPKGTEGKAQPTVRGTSEKTEYAEIVGTVQPEPSEDEKKKTPVGSNNPSPKK